MQFFSHPGNTIIDHVFVIVSSHSFLAILSSILLLSLRHLCCPQPLLDISTLKNRVLYTNVHSANGADGNSNGQTRPDQRSHGLQSLGSFLEILIKEIGGKGGCNFEIFQHCSTPSH